MDAKKPTLTDRILNALIPYRAQWQWGREELALRRADNARLVEDLARERQSASWVTDRVTALSTELEKSRKNAIEVRAALWPHLPEALRTAATKFAGISSGLHSADYSDDYQTKNRERQELGVLRKQCLRVFAAFPYAMAHAAVEHANAVKKANWQHHDWTELYEAEYANARKAVDQKIARSSRHADRQEGITESLHHADTVAAIDAGARPESERAQAKEQQGEARKLPSPRM